MPTTEVESVENVVVTGTHIRGVAPVGSLVIVFGPGDIRRSGHTALDHFLQSQPQNIRSGEHGESADARLSPGSGASGNTTFSSGINLRGLGSTATLTLLNGHRIAPSGQGLITDISQIPVAAISQIDVLADGASAIYGADAIAGVVNIRLREDLDGAHTHVGYGSTAPRGQERIEISHLMGATWESGRILAIANSLHQTQLGADERPSTVNVDWPESIFPSNRQISVLASGRQEFSDTVLLHADVQYGRSRRQALGATPGGHLELPAEIERINAFTSVNFDARGTWAVALNASISQEATDFSYLYFPDGSSASVPDRSQTQHLVQNQWAAAIAANGTLKELPAGDLSLAVGAERREERYTHRLLSPTEADQDAARTVHSAYVELRVPVVGNTNARPGAQKMIVSLAGRYDEYSDFGSIKNPKFGLSWTPVSGVEIRSTYSRSFRAPAAGSELLSSSRGTSPMVSIYSFRKADASATIPVAFVTGSTNLRPERARHWTAGVSVCLKSIEKLQLAATYYDIAYYDRIVGPPLDAGALSAPALQSFIRRYDSAEQLQAALTQLIPEGATYVDRTGDSFNGGAFGLNPQSLVTHLFDARLVNAGVVHTSGFDFAANYSKGVGGPYGTSH